ncbi:MAG: YbjN domain-containing protein [Pseudomonadota bacterium]
MRGWIWAAAVALVISSPAAAADRVVDVSSVEGVATLMREAGYKAEVKVGKDGDSYIESATGGNGFQVIFYGCKNKLGCDSFEFYSWFKKEAFFSPALANEWNASHRFLKVAIDGDGDLSEYAAVSSVGKMTFDNFKDYIEWYGTMDSELVKFVDEKRKAALPKT